jgi:hypothetical protein
METGTMYWEKQDYQNYLKTKIEALEMYEKLNLGDHIEVAHRLKSVGVAYFWVSDFKKELEYKLKALDMYERLKLGLLISIIVNCDLMD